MHALTADCKGPMSIWFGTLPADSGNFASEESVAEESRK
jgi:hypothetical protein